MNQESPPFSAMDQQRGSRLEVAESAVVRSHQDNNVDTAGAGAAAGAIQKKYAREKEYLSQLRKQQAASVAPFSSIRAAAPAVSGATAIPRKRRKVDSEESSTSSEDTHLDECEICDDGGGE